MKICLQVRLIIVWCILRMLVYCRSGLLTRSEKRVNVFYLISLHLVFFSTIYFIHKKWLDFTEVGPRLSCVSPRSYPCIFFQAWARLFVVWVLLGLGWHLCFTYSPTFRSLDKIIKCDLIFDSWSHFIT